MPDALRTATPMGDWREFEYTCDTSGGHEGINAAVAADVAGARHSYMYLVESTVGAALHTVANGANGILIYHAEKIMVPKMIESTDIFLPGMRVYWDPATRLTTPAYNSGYYWIGICVQAAAAGDLRVMIDLKGDHAEVEVELP